MKKLFLFIIATMLLAACGKQEKTLLGKWYGLNEGSALCIEFTDSIVTFSSEARSNLNVTSAYTAQQHGDTILIDMTLSQMPFLAIARITDDGVLDLVGRVQMPGVPGGRPASFDSIPTSPLFQAYKGFSRDASAVEMKRVERPAEGALAFERNARLGHGINLNNTVDGNQCVPDYPIDRPFTALHAKELKKAGFQSIRLNATWVKHCAKEAPYTIDADFMARIDNIVALCLAEDIAVSIDMHYYPYINMSEADPNLSWDENLNRFKLLWTQIAEHFKDAPETVYFDLLNEPNMQLGADAYNQLMRETIAIVRKTNPGRTLILGTPNLGQHWTIGQLDLPADDWNIIVQVHYYLPHTFTHQGLSYAMAADTRGTRWTGSEEERVPIAADFAYLEKWSEMNGRPVNVGEFGVVDYADAESRQAYLAFMRQLIDSHKMSFHLWSFREFFGIWNDNTNTWNEPLVQALNK